MSRSRPPRCPAGRGCGVCSLNGQGDGYFRRKAETKLAAKEKSLEADEYRDLPYYPFLCPDEL